MSAPEATHGLLGGRVRLVAAPGLKPTTDTVMLAAAVPAGPGSRVLDAGSGSGAAAICLAARVPGCAVVALEREAALIEAARANVALNSMAQRVAVVHGDIEDHAAGEGRGAFDAVMTNPPYLLPAAARGSPDPLRRAQTVESLPLARWIAACLAMLRPGGTLVVVHRRERQGELLHALTAGAGAIATLSLVAGGVSAAPARRILMRATRGAPRRIVAAQRLVLHGPDGAYTVEAEAILRHGAAVPWLEIGDCDPI